jgi:hypothetical protein
LFVDTTRCVRRILLLLLYGKIKTLVFVNVDQTKSFREMENGMKIL